MIILVMLWMRFLKDKEAKREERMRNMTVECASLDTSDSEIVQNIDFEAKREA